MDRLELQILTGLHAGARHSISRGAFTLGGDEQADLRLLDDEFDSLRMSFERLESGAFSVVADADFLVVSDDGRPLGSVDSLAVGQFVQVGDVWFSLQPQGAELAAIPELQSAVSTDLFDQADEQSGLDINAQNDFSPQENDFAVTGGDSAGATVQRRLRRKAAAGLVGGVLAFLVIGLGFAWLPSEAHTTESAAAKAPSKAPAPAQPAPALKPEVSRDQGVREAVSAMLEQQGFKSLVSMRVGYGEISFTGTLSRKQLGEFESVLRDVETTYGKEFRISAEIEPTASAPDFRIREVVAGKDGWIVTDAGQRIIVGGSVSGYRLLSIDTAKVVLVGPDRLEIQL